MKNLLLTSAVLLCTATFAADTNTADKAQMTLKEADTDVIDIENLEDSAEAAKRTTVTAHDNSELIDIACEDASLSDILKQFRRTTGVNIIQGDSTNLNRRVSVSIKRVPWHQALSSILNSRGFRLDEREGIYRVIEDLQAIPISTRTFQINHASAKELAELFNASYGVKDAKGHVHGVASAFEGANVVVVTASDKVISDCEAIIRAVDKAVAQIYIEARFMEISRDAMHKLGVDWSSLSSWGASVKDLSGSMSFANNRSVTLTKDGTLTVNNDNSSSSSSTTADGTKTSSSLMSTSSSSTGNHSDSRNSSSADSYARAFSGTLSVDDFRLAISAFEQAGGKQIFSNPKVVVSNGKLANIDMTTKYPNLTITSQRNNNNGASYTDYTAKLEQIQGDKADSSKGVKGGLFAGSCFYEWGITLSVKPRISPDGIISVEIIPTISTCDDFYKVGGSSAADDNAAYGNYPIIEMKTITTEFSMKDGSTAVIGGLSRTVEEDIDNGIPYLRKIPWIGPKLFGWKSREKVQKEILVCVTLGIADPANMPKDAGLPTNAVIGREYIEGKRLEPGFRQGGGSEALKLDKRPVEEIDADLKPGEVKITPAE